MKKFYKMISILCVLSLLVFPGNAATSDPLQPMQSAYIQAYGSYASIASDTTVKFAFYATGTDRMADVGAKSVSVQYSYDGEYWYSARTFNCIAFPEIMGHNKITHIASVEHTGTPGRYYRAYITFWAGDGTNGDARYMYTNVVQLKAAP